MRLVEVLEGGWQMRQDGSCITQVYACHVVVLEGVHDNLGYAVAMQAADRGVDRLEPQRAC